MLSRKLYVINSPAIIANAMKNNDISFEPIILEVAGRPLGLTPIIYDVLGDHDLHERYMDAVRNGLMGASLNKLNVNALNLIVAPLNSFKPGEEFEVPDTFIWLRDMMGRGITGGLFGEKNPFTPEVFAEIW